MNRAVALLASALWLSPVADAVAADGDAKVAEPSAGEGRKSKRERKRRKSHEHHADHDGQVGMWKDWHVEVAIPSAGDYRVWLTDAYREPVKLEGITATLRVTAGGAARVEATMTPEPGGAYLAATVEPILGVQDVEVRFHGLPEAVFMEFHFEPGPEPPGSGAPPADAAKTAPAEARPATP